MTGYFLPKVEIKDYNIMIDGQNFENFFDQPVNFSQGYGYTTDC